MRHLAVLLAALLALCAIGPSVFAWIAMTLGFVFGVAADLAVPLAFVATVIVLLTAFANASRSH